MSLRYRALPKAIAAGHHPRTCSLRRRPRYQWAAIVSQVTSLPWSSQPQRALQTTSTRLHDDKPTPDNHHAIDRATNHYETLQVQTGATPAEIKNSFYALSKTHHPDVNPDNPSASRRFIRISEAYTTLSSPEKRSKYDRDVLGLHLRHQSHNRPTGSYSSTHVPPQAQAGGRPATGLSKRRGTFRGPPPSFYRSGGWGAHSAKRQAAHDDSTGRQGARATASSANSTSTNENDGSWIFGGGMGPGQRPFGHRDDDVPHFRKEEHERTNRRNEEHLAASRHARKGGRKTDIEPERAPTGMAIVIAGILVCAAVAPATLHSIFNSTDGERDWNKRIRG